MLVAALLFLTVCPVVFVPSCFFSSTVAFSIAYSWAASKHRHDRRASGAASWRRLTTRGDGPRSDGCIYASLFAVFSHACWCFRWWTFLSQWRSCFSPVSFPPVNVQRQGLQGQHRLRLVFRVMHVPHVLHLLSHSVDDLTFGEWSHPCPFPRIPRWRDIISKIRKPSLENLVHTSGYPGFLGCRSTCQRPSTILH